MIPIVTFTAAISLTALFIILTLKVSMKRQSANTSVGNGDDNPALLKTIRAQGNLAESLPLFVVLLYLAESSGVSTTYLWGVAGLYFVARIFHAVGISQHKDFSLLRSLGAVATLLSLTILCVFLAMRFVG